MPNCCTVCGINFCTPHSLAVVDLKFCFFFIQQNNKANLSKCSPDFIAHVHVKTYVVDNADNGVFAKNPSSLELEFELLFNCCEF